MSNLPNTAEIVINWGELGEIKLEAGSFCPLTWKEKKVGWVLRSRQGCRPLFISPGHLITVAESLTVIRQCLGKYRLPLPLRAAHILSTGLRRQCRIDNNDNS